MSICVICVLLICQPQKPLESEYFRRVDDKMWELRVLTKQDQRLILQSVEVEIELSQIYRRVKWEK